MKQQANASQRKATVWALTDDLFPYLIGEATRKDCGSLRPRLGYGSTVNFTLIFHLLVDFHSAGQFNSIAFQVEAKAVASKNYNLAAVEEDQRVDLAGHESNPKHPENSKE